jgi:GxxExxY protein
MALEHRELSGRIIGAAIEVHRALGPGFLESIYEEALAIEFRERQIHYKRQVSVPIVYRHLEVGLHRLDFLVADEIVVELKTVKHVEDAHFAVVKSYLRAVQRSHGLLLNFAKARLEMRRVSAKA